MDKPVLSGIIERPKLRAGDHLGRYEILALLGGGGGGKVYRALDPTLRRHVAIKVLELTPPPRRLRPRVRVGNSGI